MEITHHDMPATSCPGCHGKIEVATGVGTTNKPSPGAWTVCLYCGSILRFTEVLLLRFATEDEVEKLEPRSRQLLRVAQAVSKQNQARRYEKQVQAMATRLEQWRQANPAKEVLIQFNFPSDIGVICGINEAMGNHFVSVNEGGRELIAALCVADEPDPTVLMVKFVLGWIHGNEWSENRLSQREGSR